MKTKNIYLFMSFNDQNIQEITTDAHKIDAVFNTFFSEHHLLVASLSMDKIVFLNQLYAFEFCFENRHGRRFESLILKFPTKDLQCNYLDLFGFVTNKSGEDVLNAYAEQGLFGLEAYQAMNQTYLTDFFKTFSYDRLEEFEAFLKENYPWY